MITFQYFEGCPNVVETMDNFKMAIKELDISEHDYEILNFSDLTSAEENKFLGSPTILVNGTDIYTDKIPGGFSYTCRIYYFNEKQSCVIPKEFILRKLKQHHN